MFPRFSNGYRSATSLMYVMARSLLVRHGFGRFKCLAKKGKNIAEKVIARANAKSHQFCHCGVVRIVENTPPRLGTPNRARSPNVVEARNNII